MACACRRWHCRADCESVVARPNTAERTAPAFTPLALAACATDCVADQTTGSREARLDRRRTQRTDTIGEPSNDALDITRSRRHAILLLLSVRHWQQLRPSQHQSAPFKSASFCGTRALEEQTSSVRTARVSAVRRPHAAPRQQRARRGIVSPERRRSRHARLQQRRRRACAVGGDESAGESVVAHSH